MEIQGKVALVTGGASGLGRATAETLAQAGASVAILDLPGQPGAELAVELGPRARWVPADVTSADEVAGAVDAVVSRFGALHILVNCAGVGTSGRVLGREGPLPLDAFERTIKINLIGTFNVLRVAAFAMTRHEPTEGERGVVVNTASVAAFDGQIGQAAYAASKAGVAGMTLPLARDLASLLIRVVTIAPGTFDTPMLAGLPDAVRESLARDVPHPHRLGAPVEFARLVRAIVENPMLNGETIRLDGALRMPPR